MKRLYKKTFKRGVHPKGNKERTMDEPSVRFSAGDIVAIPVSQHIGAPALPLVQVGDKVKMGQLIAAMGGEFSANIHSSVSGVVKEIKPLDTATGGKVKHIFIENDHEYSEQFLPILSAPTKEEIIQRVKDAGIVGMGGATFPLSIKLAPKSPVDTLIINGAECEPYITCDYRLMLEKPAEIMQGIRLLMTALGVSHAIIGVEDNKPQGIASLQQYATDGVEVVTLKTKYPQGGEKQLIYATTGGVVPDGKLPADIGKVVVNLTTAYTVYEAVVLGKPSYERMMTISGGAVENPKNFIVKIGTSYDDLAKAVGAKDYVKVISGGPMMGFAQVALRASVAKGTSSILFLKQNEIRSVEPTACINCSRCASVCPMHLMPMFIDSYALAGEYEKSKRYGAMSCIECGSCAYVCPAKRPLVQSIRLAKKSIKEKKL